MMGSYIFLCALVILGKSGKVGNSPPDNQFPKRKKSGISFPNFWESEIPKPEIPNTSFCICRKEATMTYDYHQSREGVPS